MSKPYCYIWEFEVPSANAAAFERHYGPAGSWVALFRHSPAYLGTRLLQDASRPGRYVTIDRWETVAAYRAFRAEFATQYQALDRRCEGLSSRENELGSFFEFGDEPED